MFGQSFDAISSYHHRSEVWLVVVVLPMGVWVGVALLVWVCMLGVGAMIEDLVSLLLIAVIIVLLLE